MREAPRGIILSLAAKPIAQDQEGLNPSWSSIGAGNTEVLRKERLGVSRALGTDSITPRRSR
jgi:hypothetical protein